jgi:hypothetical protein
MANPLSFPAMRWLAAIRLCRQGRYQRMLRGRNFSERHAPFPAAPTDFVLMNRPRDWRVSRKTAGLDDDAPEGFQRHHRGPHG